MITISADDTTTFLAVSAWHWVNPMKFMATLFKADKRKYFFVQGIINLWNPFPLDGNTAADLVFKEEETNCRRTELSMSVLAMENLHVQRQHSSEFQWLGGKQLRFLGWAGGLLR